MKRIILILLVILGLFVASTVASVAGHGNNPPAPPTSHTNNPPEPPYEPQTV